MPAVPSVIASPATSNNAFHKPRARKRWKKMVIDCQVVGNWKRTLRKNEVLIESAAFRPLTAGEIESFQIAAERFGEFLGLPAVLRIG